MKLEELKAEVVGEVVEPDEEEESDGEDLAEDLSTAVGILSDVKALLADLSDPRNKWYVSTQQHEEMVRIYEEIEELEEELGIGEDSIAELLEGTEEQQDLWGV